MNRCHAVLVLGLALCACGERSSTVAASPAGEPQPQARARSGHPRARSVVLFTVDTLRADRLRMYRPDAPPSPASERLARQSLVFERAYSQACNTSPAVASLLSGLLPPRHGVVHQTARLGDDVITLPMMLQAAGVRTGSFVANLCKLQDVRPSVFSLGWDVAFCGMDEELPQYRWDRAVVDAGLEFIRQAEAAGQPCFAWIHLMDPHSEYDPPPRFWDHQARPLKGRIAQVKYLSSFEESPTPPPPEVLQRLNALYDAEVSGSDHELGRLLDALDTLPGADRLALIFAADHGEELYETWQRIGHGFSMTEAVLHVPLAIRAPGVDPGRSDALVETLSITPTVLGLLGLPPPYPLDGGSLLARRPGRTVARSFESGFALTLRSADHRFWLRTVPRAPTRPWAGWRLQAPWFEQPECLAAYDGPWQNQPRWMDLDDPAGAPLLGRLRDEAQRVLDSLVSLPPIEEIEDQGYREQLRALGYLGDSEH